MECLAQSDDDFIHIDSFDDLNSIVVSLSNVLCPVAKEAKFTEIKAAKKENINWDRRWSRFAEIYNMGVDFNLNDISLSGLVTMDHGAGPEISVAQGQYVVFYDAADDNIVTEDSVVTCHVCGATCDLTSCGVAEGQSGYCWCGNSLYVACGNLESSSCSSSALHADNNETAHNGCSVCTFNDAMV